MSAIQGIEKRIIREAVRCLKRAGFVVRVSYDRGETVERACRTLDEVVAQCHQCDEEHLLCYDSVSDAKRGAASGWVYLVYGNDDGTTVISDYSTNLDSVLQPAFDLADHLSNGGE